MRVLGVPGGYVSDVIKGMLYAESVGARVLNCSLEGSWFSRAFAETVEHLNAANIVVVAAAGNGSHDIGATPDYPAEFTTPNVIAVAATDYRGHLAAFSNYGSRVDVAAPGVRVVTTFPHGRYKFDSGTSMSAPLVAGAAALLRSHNSRLSAARVASIIARNGDRLKSLEGKVAHARRLDLRKVLKAA